jgi:glycosyltransferase involved in cell wall biosynthesis
VIQIVENPERIKRAEIVVGIPSFKEADSIGHVVSTIDLGLTRFFEKKNSVIINVDNFSPDGTKDAFLNTKSRTPKLYCSTAKGVRGKGRNIKNLFQAGVELGAKAILMVDADLQSIAPDWVQYFTEPIYMGYDYVIPIYVRHKYDGTITNNITYPLTRVLYGLRTRQPIAGDFCFSGRLARAFLTEKTWNRNVSEFGIDIWMTTIAIARGFNVCQTFLGAPKSHRAKDPSGHLGPMFYQVVGTLFDLVIDFEFLWKDTAASRPTSIFGFGLGVKEDPPIVDVNDKNLLIHFKKGCRTYRKLWSKVIAEINLEDLLKNLNRDVKDVILPADLWARILFDYIVAYRDESALRDQLLLSLIPIYFLRTLGFINKTRELDTKEAEDYLDGECRKMEEEKYYLIAKWNQTPRKDGIPSIAQYLAD